MKYTYVPSGVCSRKIEVELDGDIIVDVKFIGGCNGNTKGISQLVKGQNVNDVIDRLSGITCGARSSSCPDQLAQALIEAQNV